MNTQKELLAEIKKCQDKRLDIQNYRKHIPGYIQKEKELNQLKDDYFKEMMPQFNDLTDWISKYQGEILDLKKKKVLEIPDDVKKWFREYGIGIDWGYNPPKIVWMSEDKEWVIITNPGGIGGTGTAMGTGGYHYCPTDHWLACTKWGIYHDRPSNKFGEIEGRLTKEAKQKLIDSIPHWKEQRSK